MQKLLYHYTMFSDLILHFNGLDSARMHLRILSWRNCWQTTCPSLLTCLNLYITHKYQWKGLREILEQKQENGILHPVTYASTSRSSSKQKIQYEITDKHFHAYLLGHSYIPLISIPVGGPFHWLGIDIMEVASND